MRERIEREDLTCIAGEVEATDRVVKRAARKRNWPEVTKAARQRRKLTAWLDTLCKEVE